MHRYKIVQERKMDIHQSKENLTLGTLQRVWYNSCKRKSRKNAWGIEQPFFVKSIKERLYECLCNTHYYNTHYYNWWHAELIDDYWLMMDLYHISNNIYI